MPNGSHWGGVQVPYKGGAGRWGKERAIPHVNQVLVPCISTSLNLDKNESRTRNQVRTLNNASQRRKEKQKQKLLGTSSSSNHGSSSLPPWLTAHCVPSAREKRPLSVSTLYPPSSWVHHRYLHGSQLIASHQLAKSDRSPLAHSTLPFLAFLFDSGL